MENHFKLRILVVARAGANLSVLVEMLAENVTEKPYCGVVLHAVTPDVMRF